MGLHRIRRCRTDRPVGIHREHSGDEGGCGVSNHSKPAISIAGSSGRQSLCEPYRKFIEASLEQGDPGAEAQVDFGTGAPVTQPNGKRKRPHLFRIVLSHSRKAYSEVVYRQTTEAFIRCLENSFCHFGGVPKMLVVDNLKAAVIKADWFDPDLNPKIQAFAEHYGTVVLPTKEASTNKVRFSSKKVGDVTS